MYAAIYPFGGNNMAMPDQRIPFYKITHVMYNGGYRQLDLLAYKNTVSDFIGNYAIGWIAVSY